MEPSTKQFAGFVRSVALAFWTVEAPAVRVAAQVCLRLVAGRAPDVAEELRGRLDSTPVAREHELRSATQLSTRMVRYATAS